MRLISLLASVPVLSLMALGCASPGDSSDLAESTEALSARPAVQISGSDDGKTIVVPEGSDVVLSLPSNATTGYEWIVVRTDRTFGYPTHEEYLPSSSGGLGTGGTQRFTWKTSGVLSVVGRHAVGLEYKRSFEQAPPLKTFSFTVDVVPTGPSTCANVRCAAGTHCEMKGINGGAVPVCVADAPCVRTGCSAELCADRPMPSICIFRPEAACFATAECKRQADGRCGFTQTPELQQCVAGVQGEK